MSNLRVAHFVSGYPVLSETFVREEIRSFAEAGFENIVVSLRSASPEYQTSDIEEISGADRVLEVVYPRLACPVRMACQKYAGQRAFLETFGVLTRLASSGVPGIGQTLRSLYLAILLPAVVTRLRELGVQHCHAHFAHYPADLAWACSRLLKSTLSWNAHSYDLYCYRHRFKRQLGDAGFVFPVSNQNYVYLSRMGCGIPHLPDKLRLIRCGVLPDCCHDPCRPEQNDQPTSAAFRIVAVGRLVDTKGFAILINAMPEILSQHPNCCLQIIGEGPEHHNLAHSIADLGLQEQVSLLGAKPHNETLSLLGSADLFVLPCIAGQQGLDGIPVSLMEAMSAGVPVVSTRFAAIPELVIHEHTGLLVEAGKVVPLATAIVRLIEDDTLRRQVVAAAAKLIREEYDCQKNYRLKVSMIKQLIAQNQQMP